MNYALRIRQSDECIDLLIKLKQFTHAANVAIGKGDTDALERIMEVAPVGERTEIAARMEQALNGVGVRVGVRLGLGLGFKQLRVLGGVCEGALPTALLGYLGRVLVGG